MRKYNEWFKGNGVKANQIGCGLLTIIYIVSLFIPFGEWPIWLLAAILIPSVIFTVANIIALPFAMTTALAEIKVWNAKRTHKVT